MKKILTNALVLYLIYIIIYAKEAIFKLKNSNIRTKSKILAALQMCVWYYNTCISLYR